MELKLKTSDNNGFPLFGFIIRSGSVKQWVLELQSLEMNLNMVQLYPIPGLKANSIWGCFVESSEELNPRSIGKNELCQRLRPNVFIAERTKLTPVLDDSHYDRIFGSNKFLFHPVVGTVEFGESFSPVDYLSMPAEVSVFAIRPKSGVVIPSQIRSFQVIPPDEESSLKNLEENVFPKRQKLKDKPLNLWEKLRLAAYGVLFKSSQKGEKNTAGADTSKTATGSLLDKALDLVFGSKGSKLAEEMMQDFEGLEERNQKELKKLLNMFEKDPFEALKYAIPLDEAGTSRGHQPGELRLSKLWGTLSLFGDSTSGSGGAVIGSDEYGTLRTTYLQTATQLRNSGEYEKAAFVYLKLLKLPLMAAECLEEGGLYSEAAALYMKSHHKDKAAKCYESGKMTQEAIKLYKELKKHEKVGDLYREIGNRDQANKSYLRAIESNIAGKQYVLASDIHLHKIGNFNAAQKLLIDGWANKIEQQQCLTQFLKNQPHEDSLRLSIINTYENCLDPKDSDMFLRVTLKHIRQDESTDYLREMAYSIIADQMEKTPQITEHLKKLNPNDWEIHKDRTRFLLKKRNSIQ